MNKNELRKIYRLKRKNIENKTIKDKIIYNKVINNKYVLKSDLILIYVSNNEEVNTLNIINYFLSFKKVAVPRIDNNIMNFYIINSLDELKKGYFNILEPITNNKVLSYSNSVCITPGICFDNNGYRVGYGKGFYDKFFSKNNIYKIGLCYKECIIENIIIDKYDINVDEIIND